MCPIVLTYDKLYINIIIKYVTKKNVLSIIYKLYFQCYTLLYYTHNILYYCLSMHNLKQWTNDYV